MSDISQIQVNGTTYDLCDATSRTQIANLQDSVSSLQSSKAPYASITGDSMEPTSSAGVTNLAAKLPYSNCVFTVDSGGKQFFGLFQTNYNKSYASMVVLYHYGFYKWTKQGSSASWSGGSF